MIQQGISNNPNRFVILDACGGNWGEGSKYRNIENNGRNQNGIINN